VFYGGKKRKALSWEGKNGWGGGGEKLLLRRGKVGGHVLGSRRGGDWEGGSTYPGEGGGKGDSVSKSGLVEKGKLGGEKRREGKSHSLLR